MDKIKYYLAGPMTGYPHFNFPAFQEAALKLREQGYTIVSPAELDRPSLAKAAMASKEGLIADLPTDETWGEILARDVRIIADECDGIVFLPDWFKSKGATLEAVVGLLCDYKFFLWQDQKLIPRYAASIRDALRLASVHVIDEQGGPKIMRGNNEHTNAS